MSRVTTILLSFSAAEPGFHQETKISTKLDGVNAFLAQQQHVPLRCVTPLMSGDKLPHTYTFGGAYSWLPDDAFFDTVKNIDWYYPHAVILTMHFDIEPLIVWQPS